MDIEVYPNYFEMGIKDFISKETYTFEICKRRDDRNKIFSFLTSFKGYMITFNGIHYDNVVLAYFIREFENLKNLPVRELCARLKTFSNLVIADDYESIKWYKWYEHSWIDIDLYLYWAKSLRISKKISLKSLAIQLEHNHIQELPYPHDKILSEEEMDEILYYNTKNDLVILEKLCIRMREDISLRKYIYTEYGLSCWSMDAPKICSEYLLDKFCRKTWDENSTFEEYKKAVRKERYIPKPWKIGEYLPKIEFKTKFFQDLLEEIKNSDNTFSKKFYYENNKTKVVISMGIGGINCVSSF